MNDKVFWYTGWSLGRRIEGRIMKFIPPFGPFFQAKAIVCVTDSIPVGEPLEPLPGRYVVVGLDRLNKVIE